MMQMILPNFILKNTKYFLLSNLNSLRYSDLKSLAIFGFLCPIELIKFFSSFLEIIISFDNFKKTNKFYNLFKILPETFSKVP